MNFLTGGGQSMRWNMIATWKMSIDGVREGMELLRKDGDICKAVIEAVKKCGR